MSWSDSLSTAARAGDPASTQGVLVGEGVQVAVGSGVSVLDGAGIQVAVGTGVAVLGAAGSWGAGAAGGTYGWPATVVVLVAVAVGEPEAVACPPHATANAL